MRFVLFKPFACALTVTFLTASALQSQTADAARILTTGNGEVRLVPDWAALVLEASADDSSAIAAATASTAAAQRVLGALEALGLSGDSAIRVSFSVGPRYDWTPGHEERITGYRGRATIDVAVADLTRLAEIIDTTLAAGATRVSDLKFRSYREEQARAEALRRAVAQARTDARVLAEAAGGALGPPLRIETARERMPSFAFSEIVGYARTGGPAAPELTVQDVVVFVVVETEWAFVSGGL